MAMIYHFTDSARLPWILRDRELTPGRCKIGGFPDPDFLWATGSPHGDRSASGGGKGYRDGITRLVRIALRPEDFLPWRAAATEHPDWTDEHVAQLESTAVAMGMRQSDFDQWYCRALPLSADRFLSVETRSYANNSWKPLPIIDGSSLVYAKVGDQVAAGLAIGGVTYFTVRHDAGHGRRGYTPFKRTA